MEKTEKELRIGLEIMRARHVTEAGGVAGSKMNVFHATVIILKQGSWISGNFTGKKTCENHL